MKGRVLALALAGAAVLSSCASMLDRSYSAVTPHVEKPVTSEDPSILRVESYPQLVSAVLYLVSEGVEEGTVRLHDYAGDVPADLARACAEVATRDPLGAYAVERITHEYAKVVTYYEAKLTIRYRRTLEQTRSMVNVAGVGGIRTQLGRALSRFETEVVLRVAYFTGDVPALERLLREVYYDAPETALGFPDAQFRLYPDSGQTRVVELLLGWPQRDLAGEAAALQTLARELGEELASSLERTEDPAVTGLALLRFLRERVAYDPDGPSDPYRALTGGAGNGEALALTYKLLWDRLESGRACRVVTGTVDGESRCWNELAADGGTLCLDAAREEEGLLTPEELSALGYRQEGEGISALPNG